MSPTMRSMERLTGYNRRSMIHNINQHPLANKVPETFVGNKRVLDVDSALEIAFRCTLHDNGFDPAEAADLAADWLAGYREGRLQRLPFYVINRSKRHQTPIGVNAGWKMAHVAG